MDKFVSIPNKLRTISTKKLSTNNINGRYFRNNNNKNYYTTFLDNKQNVMSFLNEESAMGCVSFLSEYKYKYGDYPIVNYEKDCKTN